MVQKFYDYYDYFPSILQGPGALVNWKNLQLVHDQITATVFHKFHIVHELLSSFATV